MEPFGNMMNHIALALFVALTLAISSPVNVAPSIIDSEQFIENIDVCNHGKTVLSADDTPTIPSGVAVVSVCNSPEETPVNIIALPLYKPSPTEPPP